MVKKRTVKKNRIKKNKKRSYNNSFRKEQTLKSQTKILTMYIELLAKKRGADVSFDQLAEVSGVSERTIFRFFNDKEALNLATSAYLDQYIEATLKSLEDQDLFSFTQNVFELFGKNEDLVLAYMFSRFGIETRTLFRKKLNRVLLHQILKIKPLELTKENRDRLALIVSLVNVKLWYDLRVDFQMPSKDIGRTVSWAISKLIHSL